MMSLQCTSHSPLACLINILRAVLSWRKFLGDNFFFLPRVSAKLRQKVDPFTARCTTCKRGASQPPFARFLVKRSNTSVVGKCFSFEMRSSS